MPKGWKRSILSLSIKRNALEQLLASWLSAMTIFILFSFFIMSTTVPIHGFVGYYFDPEKSIVLKDSKTGPRELKPYLYSSGLSRVTLYRNHNPYYVFINNLQIDGKFARIIQGKKFEAINNLPESVNTDPVPTPSKPTKAPKAEKVKKSEEAPVETETEVADDSDGDLNLKNLKKFFEARDNDPIRKDAFVKKFSNQVLEAYSDVLNIEKTEKGTYISMK